MTRKDRTIPLAAGGEIRLDHGKAPGFVTIRLEAEEDGAPCRSACVATLTLDEVEDLARALRGMALDAAVRMEEADLAEGCVLGSATGPLFCRRLPSCACRAIMAGG